MWLLIYRSSRAYTWRSFFYLFLKKVILWWFKLRVIEWTEWGRIWNSSGNLAKINEAPFARKSNLKINLAHLPTPSTPIFWKTELLFVKQSFHNFKSIRHLSQRIYFVPNCIILITTFRQFLFHQQTRTYRISKSIFSKQNPRRKRFCPIFSTYFLRWSDDFAALRSISTHPARTVVRFSCATPNYWQQSSRNNTNGNVRSMVSTRDRRWWQFAIFRSARIAVRLMASKNLSVGFHYRYRMSCQTANAALTAVT